MKARHFKKLRKKVKVYLVERSAGMWGNFCDSIPQKQVVGLSYQNAVYRYTKRTHTIQDITNVYSNPTEIDSMFGKWKIVPADTPYKRFVKYFR
jgi:hypothetical protein